MDTQQLASIAIRTRLCVGLVCDPLAEPAERWVATVGLDAIAAGPSPLAAVALALGLERTGQRAGDVDDAPLPFTDPPIDDALELGALA